MPTVIKLPRLPVNWREQPELFERYWDEAMAKIEETLNAILAIPEIEAALVDLDIATQAAQTAADNANAAAAATTSESSIVASFPKDPVGTLIEIDSAGNVTIADHVRQYGNPALNPDVPVDGATFATGAVPGDVVRVFYEDALREGGAVTYQFTIDPAAKPVQGGDVHSVAAGTVPGAGTQAGNGLQPPGYVEP